MRLISCAVAMLGVYEAYFEARQAVDGGTKASQETMTSAVCRLEVSHSVSGQVCVSIVLIESFWRDLCTGRCCSYLVCVILRMTERNLVRAVVLQRRLTLAFVIGVEVV